MKLKTFSQHFNLGKSQYELDFVDIPINSADIPLFIDPYAISKRTDRWSVQCHNLIVEFFQEVVDLIRQGKAQDAKYMLIGLREPNQTRFGLSKGKMPRGRGIGKDQATDLYNALAGSTAVKTGFITDIEDCELFIDGVGRDKISDIATNIIKEHLIEYTALICELLDIEVHQISSGMIWDNQNKKWISKYVSLPVCNKASVILVPKAIARFDMDFSHQDYYQHYVLNFLQTEHLQANSSLCRTLKSGKKKEPTKKSLKEKYPLSKKFLYDFTKERPNVLQAYKRNKTYHLEEISDDKLEAVEEVHSNFNYQDVYQKLFQIPLGDDGASAFHSHIVGILTAIFYPDLINPAKEKPIHDGRKRIDILFTNASQKGFFLSLSQNKKIPCAYIIIECKNYSSDPNNPELDQLSGRFSVNRGQFGILICRKIQNKDLFYKRCKDTANDGRGFIIALDDDDIKNLLELKANNDIHGINQVLENYYMKLVM